MAYLCSYMKNYDAAGRYYDRAIELNPNNIQAKVSRAHWLMLCGRCEEALGALEEIPKSAPYSRDFLWSHRGKTLFQLGRYDEAVQVIGRWVKPDRSMWAHAIAALMHAGQQEQARRQLDALMKAYPDTTISRILRETPYCLDNMSNHLASGLREAGLPGDREPRSRPPG
jgi:tetratricopeptide (TPR) repeat protein